MLPSLHKLLFNILDIQIHCSNIKIHSSKMEALGAWGNSAANYIHFCTSLYAALPLEGEASYH
jgi:hypothetical protein